MKIFVNTKNKWKWVLIYLPIILIFVIGISLSINHDLQNSAPYQVAVYSVAHNPNAAARYGKIKSIRLVTEDVHINAFGTRGVAKVTLKVSGDKRIETVVVNLRLRNGVWDTVKIHK